MPPVDEPKTTQEEVNEDFVRRLAELSAEIDQLRLQVQHVMGTPSSSTTSTIPPTILPPKKIFFYSTADRNALPSLSNTDSKSVYLFLTRLEKEFKLRNYELQLPADNTEGWTQYALFKLCPQAETRVLFKWDTTPNLPWATFKKWMIETFYLEKTIRDISRDYTAHVLGATASVTDFNNRFRELRLLLAFVGRDSAEDMAIRDYQEKVAANQKVALALGQFMTVERICERDPKVSIEDIMNYCENVNYT